MGLSLLSIRKILAEYRSVAERQKALLEARAAELDRVAIHFADTPGAAKYYGARPDGPQSAFWDTAQESFAPLMRTLPLGRPVLVILQQTGVAVRVLGPGRAWVGGMPRGREPCVPAPGPAWRRFRAGGSCSPSSAAPRPPPAGPSD